MTIRTAARSKTGVSLAVLAMVGGLTTISPGSTNAQPTPPRATSPTQSASAASRCSGLAGTRVEAGVVEGAEWFAKGATVAGGETAGAKVASDLCRVRLSLTPVKGSQIKVEVWLPDNWNSRLYGIGGAGFDGGLNPGGGAQLSKAAAQGYAAVATDAGHKPAPTPEVWARNQPERVVDFGYRANHLGAVVAKQVIAAYYGNPIQRSYFLGCSNGGRDGLMAASRYPEDYDAIVAGAPARRYIEVITQITAYNRTAAGPGGPALSSKVELVHSAVLKKCDELDGVKDGVIENPRACRFDVGDLKCGSGDAPTCLSEAEVVAFRRVYAGPRLRDGAYVIAGPSIGTEGVPDWGAWITSPTTGLIANEFHRWFVHDDPNWKFENFDLDRDYSAARKRLGDIIDADGTDLRPFARRGGKLIIYQGWSDPAITAEDTLRYYDAVSKRLGPQASKQVKLFMVPGMGHCAGGPGPWAFDMQPVLEKWVEQGEAPVRVVASHPGNADATFSRPLCAWPMTARYNGSGSTREAAHFTCKAPARK